MGLNLITTIYAIENKNICLYNKGVTKEKEWIYRRECDVYDGRYFR